MTLDQVKFLVDSIEMKADGKFVEVLVTSGDTIEGYIWEDNPLISTSDPFSGLLHIDNTDYTDEASMQEGFVPNHTYIDCTYIIAIRASYKDQGTK